MPAGYIHLYAYDTYSLIERDILKTYLSLTLTVTKNHEVLVQSHSETLTLSWRRPLSYRNQSIDLLRKSMDWFLYDNVLRHERVHKNFHHD